MVAMATTDLPSVDTPGTWVERVGTMGFTAKGVLWVVVGLLAASVVAGGGQADQQGALRRIESLPFGTALLVAVAIGLGAQALLRAVQVFTDPSDEDGLHALAIRLGCAARALVYGGLCATTVGRLVGSGGGGGGGQPQQLTSRALELPGGPVLVGIAALVALGIGVHQAHRGWTRPFADELQDAHGRLRTALLWAGTVGHAARAVLFATIGILLAQAAVTADPDEAGGIGEAVGAIADTPIGGVALPVVGAGLVAYGLFTIGVARWGRTRTAD